MGSTRPTLKGSDLWPSRPQQLTTHPSLNTALAPFARPPISVTRTASNLRASAMQNPCISPACTRSLVAETALVCSPFVPNYVRCWPTMQNRNPIGPPSPRPGRAFSARLRSRASGPASASAVTASRERTGAVASQHRNSVGSRWFSNQGNSERTMREILKLLNRSSAA
jgi:hypothetical protein